MRGLIKRDDRSCKLASTHQVLLGSCLTAHASGASLSLVELPLRMHMCAMSLLPRRLLSCGASAYAEAYIRWRHAALTLSSVAAAVPRAHPRAPLLASSSCFPKPQLGLLVLG